MHKFFCNFNHLTQRYELSPMRGMAIRNNATIQAENTLLPEIRQNIQDLYEFIVLIKENEKNEDKLNILDDTELLISNLYYSIFSSPLELVEENKKSGATIDDCRRLVNNLLRLINIPEYSRLCQLIKNNLDTL